MDGAKPSGVTSDQIYSISQFSDTKTPSFIMERGPRYKAYSDLRESKLRLRSISNPPPLPPKHHRSATISTPPETQGRRKGSSVLTQSVPDFSSVLRKENRKPALPPVAEKSATPPAKRSSRLYDINAKLMGSKSSGGKRSGGLMTERRSCANMDELKNYSVAAANAINGENRGGGGTTVLGSRRYY